MKRIRDIDGNDVLGFVGAIVTAGFCVAIIVFAIQSTDEQRAADVARLAGCRYIGTRVSDTWGSHTIYRYKCYRDGVRVIEETTRRFDK